jgi:hypothetical protein
VDAAIVDKVAILVEYRGQHGNRGTNGNGGRRWHERDRRHYGRVGFRGAASTRDREQGDERRQRSRGHLFEMMHGTTGRL